MPEIDESDLWIAKILGELCQMIEETPGFTLGPSQSDHLPEVAAMLRTTVFTLGTGQMKALIAAAGKFLDSVDPERN